MPQAPERNFLKKAYTEKENEKKTKQQYYFVVVKIIVKFIRKEI
jgi:hypothetical protein